MYVGSAVSQLHLGFYLMFEGIDPGIPWYETQNGSVEALCRWSGKVQAVA